LRENFDRSNFAIHKEKEMADFRRWIIALAALVLLVGSVAPASAQSTGPSLVCTASAAVAATLRHEGFTELVGDIVIACTGGLNSTPTPAGAPVPQANITVSLSAPVTSRLLSGTATEALLLVDDPSPTNQTVCTSPTNPTVACQVTGDGGQTFNQEGKFNVFQGIQGGPGTYSLTFLGVPVDPPATPGATRTFRITNVRVDATTVPAGFAGLSPVLAFVQASSSTSITINNPQSTVGYVSNGLTVNTASLNPPFLQCLTYGQTTVGTVTFMENFANAFKILTNGDQDVPGLVYYSESGLEIEVTGGLAGMADTGTRLQTVISNIPSGVTIYVDNWAESSASTGPGTLGYSDATLVTDTSVSPPADPGANTVTAITDGSQSSVTIVWEVTNTNSSAIDSLSFNIYASFTGAPGNPGSPTPNLATSALSGFNPQYPSYTSSGPIPQFSSTVNVPTAPTTLFTVSLCQTILLFPYVTDFYGFDTGIAISNTSLDNLPVGASPQTGLCSVAFYGDGAASTQVGTAGGTPGFVNSDVSYSGQPTINGTGLIMPGQTWAFSVSASDTGYNTDPAGGFTGYAIATCNFQYAHGYSFVSDTGIRNFAAAYLALIIPDAPRAPQPFTCSADGGSCYSQTGEQLVH
jgi:hypothetical protein